MKTHMWGYFIRHIYIDIILIQIEYNMATTHIYFLNIGCMGTMPESGSDRSTNATKNRQESSWIWFRTVDCKGGKCAACSVWYFYAKIWINLIDFFGSPKCNLRFFVLTNSTVPWAKNWHMAPPGCPKSTRFRADWRFYFSFAFSNDDGEAQVPPGTVLFLCFA